MTLLYSQTFNLFNYIQVAKDFIVGVESGFETAIRFRLAVHIEDDSTRFT